MNSLPRKHHYVPQFYLQGFTVNGKKDGQLWVLDKKTGEQWQSTVKKSARQTDLYRVEMEDGGSPASLENALSKIESMLAPILLRTIEKRSLPEGQIFDLFLNMVALMALRVPAFLTFSNRIGTTLVRQLGHTLIATPEAWKATTDRMRAKGIELPEISYEEMKQFVESDDYSIDVDLGQNWLAQMLIDSSRPMLSHLSRRRWYLTVVAPDAPDIICSDNPVSLSRTPMFPSGENVGFAMPGTLLLFPVNRRMVLVGSFEGIMLPNPAPEKTVALINGATGRNAERYLFSPTSDFIWRDHNNRVRHTADLLAHIRDAEKNC